MVEKSDAMKQHEKWIEETIKHKPKHTREGLPIRPIHAIFALLGILVALLLIGAMLHP